MAKTKKKLELRQEGALPEKKVPLHKLQGKYNARDAEAGLRKLEVPFFKPVSCYQYQQFCRKPSTI